MSSEKILSHMFINCAINSSLYIYSVCLFFMGDAKFGINGVDATDSQSARTCGKKNSHLASVRLTCMTEGSQAYY